MVMIANKIQQHQSAAREGTLIVIEGPHGVGKTTLINKLMSHIITYREDMSTVIASSEPGGTPFGELVVSAMSNGVSAAGDITKVDLLNPLTELFAVLAARAQHVELVIKPALAAGHTVILDRFTPSTLVYNMPRVMELLQDGKAPNALFNYDTLLNAEAISRQRISPQLNILLELDPVKLWERISMRPTHRQHRYGSMTIGQIRKTHDAYRRLAIEGGGSWVIINAAQPIDHLVGYVASLINLEITGH